MSQRASHTEGSPWVNSPKNTERKAVTHIPNLLQSAYLNTALISLKLTLKEEADG